MKNANTYLKQLRLLDVQIKQKEEELARLKSETENITPILSERVQTSASDKLSAKIAEIVDIEQDIKKRKTELIIKRHIIIEKIHTLKDPVLVEILYKRYIEYKNYKEIAEEMHYNINYVMRLKSKALDLL